MKERRGQSDFVVAVYGRTEFCSEQLAEELLIGHIFLDKAAG